MADGETSGMGGLGGGYYESIRDCEETWCLIKCIGKPTNYLSLIRCLMAFSVGTESIKLVFVESCCFDSFYNGVVK